MFDYEIEFKNIKKLPNIMALYGIYSKTGELIYIGISWTLRRRFDRHHKMSKFYEEDAFIIKWKEYNDVEQLHEDEFKLINELKPKLNNFLGKRNTCKPGTNTIQKMIKETNFSCSVDEITHNALWEYLEGCINIKQGIRDLHSNTGLSESWITSYLHQKSKSSTCNRIEILFMFLTGKTFLEFYNH